MTSLTSTAAIEFSQAPRTIGLSKESRMTSVALLRGLAKANPALYRAVTKLMSRPDRENYKKPKGDKVVDDNDYMILRSGRRIPKAYL
jgi:hypothetical protein